MPIPLGHAEQHPQPAPRSHRQAEATVSGLRVSVVALLVAFPVSAQQRAPTTAQIDALFAVTGDAPGCAVGVRHNGAVVHRAGYGLADLEHRVPITPTSVFYTGSISKQFTAASIWLAVKDGVVDLDAPVQRYVPEVPEVAKGITIRHLIHHSGGPTDDDHCWHEFVRLSPATHEDHSKLQVFGVLTDIIHRLRTRSTHNAS